MGSPERLPIQRTEGRLEVKPVENISDAKGGDPLLQPLEPYKRPPLPEKKLHSFFRTVTDRQTELLLEHAHGSELSEPPEDRADPDDPMSGQLRSLRRVGYKEPLPAIIACERVGILSRFEIQDPELSKRLQDPTHTPTPSEAKVLDEMIRDGGEHSSPEELALRLDTTEGIIRRHEHNAVARSGAANINHLASTWYSNHGSLQVPPQPDEIDYSFTKSVDLEEEREQVETVEDLWGYFDLVAKVRHRSGAHPGTPLHEIRKLDGDEMVDIAQQVYFDDLEKRMETYPTDEDPTDDWVDDELVISLLERRDEDPSDPDDGAVLTPRPYSEFYTLRGRMANVLELRDNTIGGFEGFDPASTSVTELFVLQAQQLLRDRAEEGKVAQHLYVSGILNTPIGGEKILDRLERLREAGFDFRVFLDQKQ